MSAMGNQFRRGISITTLFFGVLVSIVGVALFSFPLNAATDDIGPGKTANPRVDSTVRPSQPGGAQPNAPANPGTGVFINQQEITQKQWDAIKRLYGAAPPGHYWY